jgi:uncharacterized phage protein gp47/JayE
MPIVDTSIFRPRAEILAAMLSTLQDAVPQVYVGEDGVLRIVFEIEAGQIETVYLAAQLLLEDIFPQTASAPALRLHGDTYNLPFLTGEYADGLLKFTGEGGTFIPSGSQAGADPGGGLDLFLFTTSDDAEIPNPGVPTAPVATVSATTGVLTGTYEYVVSFVNASGETLPSPESNAVAPAAKQVNLTAIPLGGAGTTARKIFRQKDGTGDFKLVTTIANNTATTFTDNVADASTGPSTPVEVGTATSIEVTAVATIPGTSSNAAAATITHLVAVPSGITEVTNLAPFTGGTNQEDVESYRGRLLEYLRNPRTGSVVDLEFWAGQIQGVDSSTIFPNDNMGTPAPGHVTIRIVGPDGTIPPSDVIAAVQEYLNEKDVANITIHVGTFTATTLAITVDVTLDTGYILGDVELDVKQAVSDYVASVGIAGTVYKAGVIDAVFGLAGIIDVTTTFNNTTAGAIQKYITGIDDVTVV